MHPAERCDLVSDGVYQWQSWSPVHKVDLTASAVRAGSTLFIFDPIPLAPASRERLVQGASRIRVVLTNGNHERDAAGWGVSSGTEIWVPDGVETTIPTAQTLPVGEAWWDGWQLFPLPGGPVGETAFLCPDRSLAVVGDAVVNLPGRGLEILPERYCRDHARLRLELRALARIGFTQLLMAHGTALREDASGRVAALTER